MNEDLNITLILVGFIILIAICITLLTPFLSLSSGYGEFIEKEGKCLSGVKTIDSICVPSKLGKGCLLNGKITYNTYRRIEECDNYEIGSKWGPIEYSNCVSGKMKEIRECVKIGNGINNCYIPTLFGNEYYSIGDVYEKIVNCNKKEKIGNWIQISPEYSYLPKDEIIPKGNIENVENISEIYTISDLCTSDEILSSGEYKNILACEIGEELYIPSKKENKYCRETPPNNIVKCRYLPKNYSYYFLSFEGACICVEHLPGNNSKNIPFFNTINPGNFKYPEVELVISEIPNKNNCSRDEILTQSCVGFIFVKTGKKYKIYLNIAGSYPGVLILRNSKLYWRQAKIGPNSPGVDEGDLFELEEKKGQINFTSGIKIKNLNTQSYTFTNFFNFSKFSTNLRIDSKECSIYTNGS